MTTETKLHIAFIFLLLALFAMRLFFMLKVRRSGERLTPSKEAIQREGGRGILILRAIVFFLLIAVLVMYIAGMPWIEAASFPLPAWLRWAGFGLGLLSLIFWTWTQVTLDQQWSAQLQLIKEHHLITRGPYERIRHPLYSAMFGWSAAVALLTANWLFVGVAVLSIAGTVARVPKEEQMMMERFGDEYNAYMDRTGRFFPKLTRG